MGGVGEGGRVRGQWEGATEDSRVRGHQEDGTWDAIVLASKATQALDRVNAKRQVQHAWLAARKT